MNQTALTHPSIALSADRLIGLRHVALAAREDAVLAASPGGFASPQKGRGLEIADLREYQTGDDLRHLDRGATARTGRLHVRQFQEERDRIVLLVADFRAPMFWGLTRVLRSVAAAEALCLIGWTVITDGGRVGLLTLGDDEPVVLPPRGRDRAMLAAIGGLVSAHQAGLARLAMGELPETSLDDQLGRVMRLAPAGAEIIIASGFDHPGQGFAEELGKISRRRRLRLLNITAAQSEKLPAGSYPIRLPNGQRLRVNLGAGPKTQAERIEGWPVTSLDAGDPVEAMARQLVTGLEPELAQ